jgi:hypothetical protein
LRAIEHRESALVHDELARQQSSWPLPTTSDPGFPVTVPWWQRWRSVADHEHSARNHRSKAASLEAAYAEACGTREIEKVVGSPLIRHWLGGWNTRTGVVVYLSPLAGSPETVLADLRCHRAWMMLGPLGGMEDCPFDLPGLVVDARDQDASITLILTVRDPKLVPELQRRVARQAEQAAGERTQGD